MAQQRQNQNALDSSSASESGKGELSRRGWLASAAGVTAGAVVGLGGMTHSAEAHPRPLPKIKRRRAWRITKDRIHQSVVEWCFRPMKLDALVQNAVAMGFKSVELLEPKDWAILKKNKLVCAMTPSHMFVRGMNKPEYHAECLAALTKAINATSDAGFPNVITFSGFSEDIPVEEGIKNCIIGLKKIMPLAEKKKVNVCMEILNTRVKTKMKGHPGYQADTIEYCAKVCEGVGSKRMKILFDCYHVQIMEGDVIARIRKYKDHIAHYHIAGNPGRNELDDTQEMHYPGIMHAILETGYQGYVRQEFLPEKSKNPMAALRDAAKLCDI